MGYIMQISTASGTDSDFIIFSPFFVEEYDLSSQYGTSMTIKIAKEANVVAVACGIAGILLIDGKTQKILNQKTLEGETVKGLALTKDGKYLMLGYQNQFSIFEYKQDQGNYNLVLISQSPFLKGNIQDVILNSKENIAFAYGTQGILIAFDIQSKDSPQQIGTYFSTSAQVRRAIISKDDSFLFLADDINGLVLLKIKYEPQFELIVATIGGSTWWQSWSVAVTSNNRYAYVIDNWDGIWIADLQNVYDTDEALYPINIQYTKKFWPYPTTSVYSAIITKDDNYLLVGQRSQGVQIIDIRNKTSPIHYMTIPCEGVGFDLRLSEDEQFLYYASAKSVVIFIQSLPNLNNNYPNLHNFQQTGIDSFPKAKYPWRCSISKDNNYFYGSFSDGGVYIMDLSNDPYHMKFQSRIMPKENVGMTIDIAIVKQDKYIYLGAGSSSNIVYVYDISDKTKPKLLNTSLYNGQTDSDGLFFSQDQKLLAVSNYSGVLLFDISNPNELTKILEWFTPPSIFGSVKDVVISQDTNYIIGAVRGYGFFALDISNRLKPELKSTLQTSGAEGMRMSLNWKYLYCHDGFRGLTIIDLQQLPKLVIVSRLQLSGWANYIAQMFNDEYLLVDTYENGQLSLIDIRDIYNPLLVSKYDSKRENAAGICTTNDFKYGFIITDKGVRTIPLKSDITIHTQISQIIPQSIGKPILKTLYKNDNLLVNFLNQFGQNMNFLFVQKDVFYYDNYEMKLLPYWMNYQSSSQSLQITVVKEALGSNWSKPNLNTVIIKTAVPLTANSFLYNDEISTNLVQANLIHSYLIEIQLIDSNNFVTQSFDYNLPFSFTIPGVIVDNMSRLYDLVKLTLMKGIYYNPIQFKVAPSLSLNITDTKSPIKTTSQNVNFIMAVSEVTGKFVKQTVSGVIISYTDSQNQIKLEGSLENVNNVLSQRIYFSLSNTTQVKTVTITVIDNVNYDVVNEYQIDKIPFISLNIPTKKGKALQPQVDNYYSGGNLPIESDISISFSPDSFIDPDSFSLKYTAQIFKGGEYEDVPSDFFLQLSPTELKLTGKTKESQLNTRYDIRIKASDGYSEAFDSFVIVVDILPFFYVFNLLIKIFGPIIGALGIYKYKSDILNVFFKKKTIYSQEIAIVNSIYRKQITIMGNDLERTRELYQEFKNKIISKENIFIQDEKEKRMYFYQNSINTINGLDLEKKNDQNKANLFSQTRRLKHLTSEDDYLTKAIYNIQMMPPYKPTTILALSQFLFQLEKLYLRKDGTIAMTKMYRDMLQLEISYSLNGKRFQVKSDIKEFQNKDSRFFKCLQGIVARDFIKNDFKANLIYEYLKHYAKKEFQYELNDWYKVYVDIKATDKRDKYDQQVPFPDLDLKQDIINRVLMDLSLNNQKGQTLEDIQKLGINHHLIKMNLFCDALGITVDSPPLLKPCVGESLHLQFFEVHSVEAFKHIKNAWFMKARELLGLDYMSYGMSKNMTLPHWLQFDIKNGVLILEGIPALTDIDELLIRVYDEDKYIVQHFILKIVDEYNPDQDIQNLENNFDNSNILNQNDQLDFLSSNRLRISMKEKNQQKISQFKQLENQHILVDSQIDRNNISTFTKMISFHQQNDQITKSNQVDEIFSVQTKQIFQGEETTNRLILERGVSSISQRDLQDGDASFIRMQQHMDAQNQQQSQENTQSQKPNTIIQGLANKNLNYFQ